MKKRLSVLLALALSVSMLTACGGSGTTSGGSNNSGAQSGTEQAKGGNVIKLAVSTDLTSLDPHNHNDSPSGYATRHIYSTLIRLNENNEFVGDLVEKWDYKDDKTVEFTLKDGVKFHNGETLKADDVKFSLERQKESPKVGHLITMIDSIEVVDDLHFVLHLNTPSNALISSLAHMGSAILCKSYVEGLEAEGKKIDDYPMGTGPYSFVNWTPGSSWELKKFDDYFDESRKAQNDGLLAKIIPEESSRTIALENGEVDILINVPATDAQKIRDNDKLVLDEYIQTVIEYFCMNVEKAPFDNVKVRQAMNYAINKDDVSIAAINGEGTTTNSYIGEAAIGWYDTCVKYDYNPEKAKELLAEAGYGDGFTFTCFVSSDKRARAATVVQANLQELGITMEIEQMEASTFYDRTGKGEHAACMSGWVANAEPDNTYRPLFTSEKAGPGGNRSFYKNPEVDALVDDAAVNLDKDKVAEDYKTVLKTISEDAIWAPLYSETGLIARNKDLQGLGISPIGMHDFSGLHY